MKNYFLILALFATMLVGCDKPNDPQPEAKKPVSMLEKSSVHYSVSLDNSYILLIKCFLDHFFYDLGYVWNVWRWFKYCCATC
jgi:hypothetical protein